MICAQKRKDTQVLPYEIFSFIAHVSTGGNSIDACPAAEIRKGVGTCYSWFGE